MRRRFEAGLTAGTSDIESWVGSEDAFQPRPSTGTDLNKARV